MSAEAAAVVAALTAREETLAVAESLTGGLLAAAVADVPGASAMFRGGLTAYATEVKADLLGVAADLLGEAGPVDPRVALGMAAGARRLFASDWALATTGVAGPGPSDGKPEGTVFVACAGPEAAVVRELALTGDRAAIRADAVAAALDLMLVQLGNR